MKHQIKYKIITFVISLIFVAILILLFFLDTSLEWGFEKIKDITNVIILYFI